MKTMDYITLSKQDVWTHLINGWTIYAVVFECKVLREFSVYEINTLRVETIKALLEEPNVIFYERIEV